MTGFAPPLPPTIAVVHSVAQRQVGMLHTAMGPAIAAALEDPYASGVSRLAGLGFA